MNEDICDRLAKDGKCEQSAEGVGVGVVATKKLTREHREGKTGRIETPRQMRGNQ